MSRAPQVSSAHVSARVRGCIARSVAWRCNRDWRRKREIVADARTVDEKVDIHAPGVEVKKSACYFCHQNCGVLAYVKDGDVSILRLK